MEQTNDIERPSNRGRKLVQESYSSFISAIEQLKSDQAEIEIEKARKRILLPVKALKLLCEILKGIILPDDSYVYF